LDVFSVGLFVGTEVMGWFDGVFELIVGLYVGTFDGVFVGCLDGSLVGCIDGSLVGCIDGSFVGLELVGGVDVGSDAVSSQ
jgi:hypothetical protein